MLARPDNRLANFDPWILSNPCPHYVHLFASLFVKQKAPFDTQVTMEPPMYAQPLIHNNGMWTSATWNTMLFHVLDPMVIISHRLAPQFGMCAPFATSYSTPPRGNRFCEMLMPSQSDRGITVTRAPESTVISISIHSLGSLIALIPGRLTCYRMLNPEVVNG